MARDGSPYRHHDVEMERVDHGYAHLFHVAHEHLKEAEETEEGSRLKAMAAIVFTAFGFEAYLNHLGFVLLEERWKHCERAPYKAKVELICAKLKGKSDFESNEFKQVIGLMEFRNSLAHGRTHRASAKERRKLKDGDRPRLPDPEWLADSTPANARRYFDVTKRVVEVFHEAARQNMTSLWWLGSEEWRISPPLDLRNKPE